MENHWVPLFLFRDLAVRKAAMHIRTCSHFDKTPTVVQAVAKPERADHPAFKLFTDGRLLMKLLSSNLGRALLPLVPSGILFPAVVVKEFEFARDELEASTQLVLF